MRSVTEVDQAIGQRIQAARKRRGVSMRELGAAITVSVQQMQKYEAGVNRISAGNIVTLAQRLEIPVTDLLGVGEPTAGPAALSDRALALATAYDGLPASRMKDALHDLIMAVAAGRETGAES